MAYVKLEAGDEPTRAWNLVFGLAISCNGAQRTEDLIKMAIATVAMSNSL